MRLKQVLSVGKLQVKSALVAAALGLLLELKQDYTKAMAAGDT